MMRLLARLAPAALSLLLVAACGQGQAGSSVDAPPDKLFRDQCAACHLSDGSGGPLAPSLFGKRGYWTREKLIAYLKDPQGYADEDPRLRAQGERYSLPMTTFKMLPEEALGKLADFVLALP